MINVARSLVMMFPSCCLKTPPIGSDHSTAGKTRLLTEIFNYFCQLSDSTDVDVALNQGFMACENSCGCVCEFVGIL